MYKHGRLMARIGINAQLLTFARSYRNTGTSSYIYQLLQHLPDTGSPHQFVVFTNANQEQLRAARLPHYQFVPGRVDGERPAQRILWEQTALPVQLVRHRVDLVHGMLNVLPAARVVPGVVTVHDVAFLRFPERYLPAKRRYLTVLTTVSVRSARLVIASSENTRNDLVRLLHVPGERVRVVHLGVEDRLRAPVAADDVARLRERHGLPEQFFLYIGTLEPRKNLVRLLEAYERARRLGVEWPLVLAGAKGWLYDEIFARVQSLGLDRHVHFPGYVLYEDLPLWYNAASAFVYPSLYEGFGLPIAEAMACGCPVLTARNSSLPEVAGDAAILVEGEDTTAMSEGLVQLAGDADLRVRLRERGRLQAAKFTWQRTAAQVVGVYGEVLTKA